MQTENEKRRTRTTEISTGEGDDIRIAAERNKRGTKAIPEITPKLKQLSPKRSQQKSVTWMGENRIRIVNTNREKDCKPTLLQL